MSPLRTVNPLENPAAQNWQHFGCAQLIPMDVPSCLLSLQGGLCTESYASRLLGVWWRPALQGYSLLKCKS